MQFKYNQDIQNCAELVQKGDPDRFMSTMTAHPDQRGVLFVLYAFNLEISRAPWVTKEAMIAEMRLQWWMDAIEEIYEGGNIRRHEVVRPLADMIKTYHLPRVLFDDLIAARRWDIYKDPHSDDTAFEKYITATSGNLMAVGALATGAPLGLVPDILNYGYGAGIMALFRAVPKLKNTQRYPLLDDSPAAISKLAKIGLERMDQGRSGLKNCPKSAKAALRSAWSAQMNLQKIIRNPELVLKGQLKQAEFIRKLSLLLKVFQNSF